MTRIINATPNGIDRVDYALASHFLAPGRGESFGSAYLGAGSCLLPASAAHQAIEAVAANWGERASGIEADNVLRSACAWLRRAGADSGRPAAPVARQRRFRRPKLDVLSGTRWLVRHGGALAGMTRSGPPRGAVYINVSQFPLWISAPYRWLETRRDVRALFFIHDLLPIEFPEYFRPAEQERHLRRLRNVARFASAAAVTTRTVEAALRAHMVSLGRRDLPIFVAPTPLSPIFAEPRAIDPTLTSIRYFVLCSTLEPRKNHLMILAVWRALAARLGDATPKLLLVGTRGWLFEPLLDLLERSPALRQHVREVNGLSTPGLKRLMDNAAGVLMPTFGEGYGLPVHEALSAGTPVLASDIPAFREIEADGLTLISPLNGDAWLAAIEHLSAGPRVPAPVVTSAKRTGIRRQTWDSYFDELETFADRL